MPYIYRFITSYNSVSFFLTLCPGRKSTLCAIQTLLRAKKLWLPAEVMKKMECLKLITALTVGLSFLAIIILSSWSSTIKLRRLDGNYTGEKTLYFFQGPRRKFLSGGGGY